MKNMNMDDFIEYLVVTDQVDEFFGLKQEEDDEEEEEDKEKEDNHKGRRR